MGVTAWPQCYYVFTPLRALNMSTVLPSMVWLGGDPGDATVEEDQLAVISCTTTVLRGGQVIGDVGGLHLVVASLGVAG